ncbi:hypothetical protein Hanom_Chr13g01230171 [Helianthus anomalus]
MKRRVGMVIPRSFWVSESDFAVRNWVGRWNMASLRMFAALRSVWMSIMLSSDRFLTHFNRTFVMLRDCWWWLKMLGWSDDERKWRSAMVILCFMVFVF